MGKQSEVVERPMGPSRRDVLRTGTMAAAAIGLAPLIRAQGGGDPGGGSVNPPGSQYGLVHRITMGFTTAEAKLFDQKGFAGYLEYHLAPETIDDSYVNSRLDEFPTLGMTPYTALSKGYNSYEYIQDAINSHILRQTFSKRQLQEVMTEFWIDHFNVFCWKADWYYAPFPENAIRAHALGKFSEILMAVAKSAAMMAFLDNTQNYLGNSNENYARELMELHTVGSNGGYTEKDVYAVAKAFTGWNAQWDSTKTDFGKFLYWDGGHDQSAKKITFLKLNLPVNGGIRDGERVLNALAAHPSCANFISKKLCERFLCYDPPEATVAAVAAVFLSSGGDIKAVLRAILTPDNLATVAKPKLKRPHRLVISGFRALNASVTDLSGVQWDLLYRMAQNPFNDAAPNGYQDHYEMWASNMLPRWYYAFNLPLNWDWYAHVDLFAMITNRTPAGVVAFCDRTLFGSTLPQTRKTQIRKWFARPNIATNDEIREAVSLALASPEFQYY